MSPPNIKKLIKTRSSLKQRQTRFKEHLDAFLNLVAGIPIEQTDRANILELETRLDMHQTILQEFDDVQVLIEEQNEDENDNYKEREEFEKMYFSLTAKCKQTIIDYYKVVNAPGPETMQIKNKQGCSDNDAVPYVQNIKLPEIKLPKYSGAYENWLEFRDTFDSLINLNQSLSEIQKYHYLRAALEGSAAQVVRSLEFSANNYSVAWDTLLNRYNNENVLVHNHVKAIFDIPALNRESFSELRKMLDTLSKHLRSLQTLNQPIEHWDTLLIYILTNKLDKTTARDWEETKVHVPGNNRNNKMPTLNDFKLFIKNKADLLETLTKTSEITHNKKP
ncbi:hypothetical protein NQ314_004210 [Rhamnusium bicolor]|uniref:Uncharacterized protein n=1 Tax=Rhamnusium bicolor TaxID=1586634 RepID=A0AAV8ZLR3_9CUCU|nr:hypothetical protein NQ314_004210 [Rhamnusium bicolor]